MADFAEVKDKTGTISGLWISSSQDANDQVFLVTLLMRLAVPQSTCASVIAGDYRVVANTADDKGGCFVMFGPAPVEDSPSANCEHCQRKALSTAEYEQECQDAGFVKDASSGQFKMKVGGLAGIGQSVFSKLAEQEGSQQAIFARIEGQRGYRCKSCRSVYCMDCLYTIAPAHSRGGKACPKCGDTFEHHE